MKTDTSYREICERLGFQSGEHFVRVLPGGAVSFTAGKPEEIRALADAAEREGLKLSRALRAAVETL